MPAVARLLQMPKVKKLIQLKKIMIMNNNDFNGGMQDFRSQAAVFEDELTMRSYTSRIMRRVYVKMFLGLLVTALSALMLASSEALFAAVFSSKVIFFGLIIAELAVVFVLSGAINRISAATATILFYLYSVLNGVVLSSIFYNYSSDAVMLTFGITSAVFAAMSIFGFVTKQDLTKMGTFLFMALIGLIVASIVNVFLGSSALDWGISLAGVAIFIGLTAWDTQKIKQWAMESDPSQVGKLATLGALSLYLDFINLFLYLLRIFGGSSRN